MESILWISVRPNSGNSLLTAVAANRFEIDFASADNIKIKKNIIVMFILIKKLYSQLEFDVPNCKISFIYNFIYNGILRFSGDADVCL